MKKNIPIKYIVLAGWLLAAGMGVYWFTAGIDLLRCIAIVLSILLVSSPLAYYLSAGLVLKRAENSAEKSQIEIKSKNVIERLASIDTILLSKSGILTEGKPYISDIIPEGLTKASLLGLAGSAERDAKHPIGKLIYETALFRGLRLQRLSAFNEIPHCGVETIISGTPVRVGNLAWLQGEKIKISADLLTKQDQLACRGKTAVFVSNGNYAKGIISLGDDLLPDSKEAVHHLHRLDYSTVLLTSDNHRIASYLQKISCVQDVKPNLTSSDKAREIQLMRTRGLSIAMIGNNENDDLAFSEADISIKLLPRETHELRNSELQDLLQEEFASAEEPVPEQKFSSYPTDFTLHGRLEDVIPVLQLAHNAHSIIRQNKFIAYIYWLIFLPFAMGLPATFGGPFLNPDMAFVSNIFASLLVLLNSLRMK